MPPPRLPLLPLLPRLTQARAELLQTVQVQDAQGLPRELKIPHERALTVFVDRRELVTLMTLGVAPELLVLGWLLNQRLVAGAHEVEAVGVDWAVHAAAVTTRAGLADLARRTEHRIVTTGCGQGTVFGDLIEGGDVAMLPPLPGPGLAFVTAPQIVAMLEAMRLQDNLHRQAGSVHGCALFAPAGQGVEMLYAVEDVGRHNAIDTLTGWMAMQRVAGAGKLLYTTGRLTSEMVMKAALMGLAIVVSRNGVTAMGLQMAERVGMTLIGRAVNRHWFCYCGAARVVVTEPPAGTPTAASAAGR